MRHGNASFDLGKSFITDVSVIPTNALQGGVTFPWDSAVILAPLCCGAIVVLLFCLWEWKGARLPIVPSKNLQGRLYIALTVLFVSVHIFKHVTVCGVNITMFIK